MNSSTLKALHVCTQDHGGAAIAVLRLMDALQGRGIAANMLTYYKHSKRPDVQRALDQVTGIDKIWLRGMMRYSDSRSEAYRVTHQGMWSSNQLPNPLHHILNRADVDLLHLHWIGNGFLPIATLSKLSKPLVWTLHDMWGFTGGCHVADECLRYQQQCGHCPKLNSQHERDLSRRVFLAKQKSWRGLEFTIVAPSNWLADCARNSALFHDKQIAVIPHPINTDTYQLLDKTFSRKALHLSLDKKLIVFGAGNIHDPNKGIAYLESALQKLQLDDAELITFGAGKVSSLSIPIPIHAMGTIQDERLLALIYNAADVLVAPSRKDNLPSTVMEALTCGTPCVAFNIGGMPDMIDHQHNGYLAQPFDVADLANGIRWVLNHPEPQALSSQAREKVIRTFNMDIVAKQYVELYQRVLGESSP